MKPLIITLDGPSGSGKSTASVRLAKYFKIPCLDTGAMYRTVAYKATEANIPLDDSPALSKLASKLTFKFGFDGDSRWVEVLDNGSNMRMGKEIRTPEVSLAASKIAKLPKVREVLVRKQQEIGRKDGAVVEGRDAGTVIFPHATIKFFVTASAEERAKRRHKELVDSYGIKAQDYGEVLKEILLRDRQDEEREASPSKPADDALIIDTSNLDFEKVVQFLKEKVESRLQTRAAR
ncbi:MAG: (d)CMP kinase [Bacteriovoracaceae bacterium]|nr:(d)CMP kinase [Bacteriovoracaceae bacterium]